MSAPSTSQEDSTSLRLAIALAVVAGLLGPAVVAAFAVAVALSVRTPQQTPVVKEPAAAVVPPADAATVVAVRPETRQSTSVPARRHPLPSWSGAAPTATSAFGVAILNTQQPQPTWQLASPAEAPRTPWPGPVVEGRLYAPGVPVRNSQPAPDKPIAKYVIKRMNERSQDDVLAQVLKAPSLTLDKSAARLESRAAIKANLGAANIDVTPALLAKRADLAGLPVRRGPSTHLSRAAARHLQEGAQALQM